MKRFTVRTLAFIILLSTLGTMLAMATPHASIAPRGVFYHDRAITKAANTIVLSKKILKLKNGKSSTLKAILNPEKQDAAVLWWSYNTKVAKVSSNGKVTAVAPGTAWIVASAKGYSSINDGTGDSSWCFVIVEGSSEDPKPLGANDEIFYYNGIEFRVPAWTKTVDYHSTLMNVVNIINNGNNITEGVGGRNNEFISIATNVSSPSSFLATIYYFVDAKTKMPYSFFFTAFMADCPIKTYRGIKVGGTKNALLKAYGLPTYITPFNMDGIDCESYVYQMYSIKSGRAVFMEFIFYFQKSKTKIFRIHYSYGLRDW